MYLLLSVAGHLTIFLTRTRGPFWSIRPARILWIAVLGTQMIATLIAVYGLFMTPIGWKLAGVVWGYAIVCALLTDRVKLLGYRFLDPVKADKPKPEANTNLAKSEAKAEPKPETKVEEPKTDAKADESKLGAKADTPKPEVKADAPKPEAKVDEPKTNAKADEPKPEATAEAKPEAKNPPDLTPQIAKRAYEHYEERIGNDGTAVQDWKKAEREIRNDEAKAEPKPEAKAEESKPDANAEPKPEAKADDMKPETKTKAQPDATPQLVKRVHELYEELGREDVQAVQDWEKAHPELEKHESRK